MKPSVPCLLPASCLTFARNSLVRDMTFRGNFLIDLSPRWAGC